MKTKKIIDLLSDSSNEESEFATKNGILQIVKEQNINITKKILSKLREKVLNQVFVILLIYLF